MDWCVSYFSMYFFLAKTDIICYYIENVCFCEVIMKSNLLAKLLISVCLCLVAAFTFTACKDKEIYANHSDFESYPEYWNSFNQEAGEIYIPDAGGNSVDSASSNTSSGASGSSDSSKDTDITSSDDYTAYFEDDEISNENNNGTSSNGSEETSSENDTSSDSGSGGSDTPSSGESTNQGPLVLF